MDKFHGSGFAYLRVKYFFVKDNCGIFFFIVANKEKNEGGEITAKAENMYTNLFQFPTHNNT